MLETRMESINKKFDLDERLRDFAVEVFFLKRVYQTPRRPITPEVNCLDPAPLLLSITKRFEVRNPKGISFIK
jgi:hypothetical protein